MSIQKLTELKLKCWRCVVILPESEQGWAAVEELQQGYQGAQVGPNHRLITPRWPWHIRPFLAQHLLPWWGKCACARDKRCRAEEWSTFIFVKGKAAHCLKYSLKFQGLHDLNFCFDSVFTFLTIIYHLFSLYHLSLAQAHLTHHGKGFWPNKRRICFVHLGVIDLWFQ